MEKLSFNILKINFITKLLMLLLLLLAGIGVLMQYSAGDGSWNQYALPFLIRYLMAFLILFVVYKIDIKLIFSLADYFYFFVLFLLIIVEIIGDTRLGAKRWLDFKIIAIQPSELMKIAIILILAKYFHNFSISQLGKLKYYFIPIIYVFIPVIFIIREPDLGTAIILLLVSAGLLFLSGLHIKYFYIIAFIAILLTPVAWYSLHDYQKERILIFINPDKDPIGSGYHIIQSKIAIGSGGLSGKGFLNSTQAQLDFLPEKHTDFIFTLLSEEFGFIGSVALICLYILVLILLTIMTIRCSYPFGQYVISGVAIMLFIYVFINIGMVSGLLPVVGIPLPFISYGGTSLITMMIGFGLVINIENSIYNV